MGSITFSVNMCPKFTVLLWVKFESGKKTRKFFFFKRDILKKNTNNLTRIKIYSLNGFSIFS